MKKFGKLRQWTDEKLGATQKTVATEQFRDMEAEIQVRQQGLESVHLSSVAWMKALGKQKKTDGQELPKCTPLESLGTALYQHGDEFAPESAYGQSLTNFGIAQQKVARFQHAFHQKVTSEILPNMEASLALMQEYQAVRKKLESRRLTYDSALTRVQKAKREDSKMEEDLRTAKFRYEEVSNDVHERMLAIRKAETCQQRDIVEFINAQTTYFRMSYEVMLQLQSTTCGRTQQMDLVDAVRNNHTDKTSSLKSIADLAMSSESSPNSRRSDLPPLAGRGRFLRAATTGRIPTALTTIPQSVQVSGMSNEINSRAENYKEGSIHDTGDSPTQQVLKALYDFDAEAEHELSIRRGDLVQVLEHTSEGWWCGQIINETGEILSLKGLFPVNYCSVQGTLNSIRGNGSTQSLESTRSAHQRNSISEPLSMLSIQSAPNLSMHQSVSTETSSDSSIRTRKPPPPVPKKKRSSLLEATRH